MEYSIQINRYEGPMDLLLDLISKNRIEITDISIIEITEQYLEYIDNMQKMDLELTSDFVSMASKLIEIKSRYILYLKNRENEEQDPRIELVRQIEEYNKYRLATEKIKERVKEYEDVFYREYDEKDEVEEVIDFKNITMESIQKILMKIADKIDFENIEKPEIEEEHLRNIVEKKNVSVEEKIEHIRSLILKKENLDFRSIVADGDRKEIIANFLALLELIKLKEIVISQSDFCDDISIRRRNEDMNTHREEEAGETDEIEKRALRKLRKKEERRAQEIKKAEEEQNIQLQLEFEDMD